MFFFFSCVFVPELFLTYVSNVCHSITCFRNQTAAVKKEVGPIEPCEIIIAKDRQDGPGMVVVGFSGATTSFHDLEEGYEAA